MAYVYTRPTPRRAPRIVFALYYRRARRTYRLEDGAPLTISRDAAVALAASATLAALRGAK